MSISTHFSDASLWAQTHFSGTRLGNTRRSVRVCILVSGWARQPGVSIARLHAGHGYASKAAYQLLGLPSATSDALQAPHRQLNRQQLQAAGTYLFVEDTTELSWSEVAERRPGLGPVGSGQATSQGVLLHSLVAAAWPATDPDPAARWPALPQSLRAVGSPAPGTRWVVVADRGADIYEHLRQTQGLGFVVRAAQDRALVAAPAGTAAVRLFELARAQPSAGQFPLSLRGRPRQPVREVVLQVSFTPALAMCAPQRPGGTMGKGEPVPACPAPCPAWSGCCSATSPPRTSPRPWFAPASTPAAGSPRTFTRP